MMGSMTTAPEERPVTLPVNDSPTAAGPREENGSVDRQTAPATVIVPARGWQAVNLGELWTGRELVFFLAWRDVKVRYKQTVLGAAWAVLQPALMMVVFTLFFGRVAIGTATADVSYPLFVLAGLLPWTFFATAVTNAGNSVVGSERLITKIYFPRLAIPLAAVLAAAVDFVVSSVLLLGLMAYYRVPPGAGLLLAPLVAAVVFLAALGVGTLLAALNVAYRDFRYVIPFLTQVWMFATPTIYLRTSAAGAGSLGRVVTALNPMAALVSGFRAAALGRPLPWAGLGQALAVSLVILLIGCFYFRKVEGNFADII